MQELESLFQKIDDYQLDNSEATFSKLDRIFIYHFEYLKINIFNDFLKKVENESFKDKCLKLFLKTKRQELFNYLSDDKKHQLFHLSTIIHLSETLKKVNHFDTLITFFISEMNEYKIVRDLFLENNPNHQDIENHYPILQILKLFYQERNSMLDRHNILNMICNEQLLKMYKDIGIDISNNLNSNYGLLTFDNEFMNIYCDKDNQKLIDKRIVEKFGKHFSILYNHRLLLSCLNHLFFHEKMIGELSFRVDSIIDKACLILDEFDFGSKLKVDISNLPKISRFYNLESPKDNLWIFHDKQKNQISFEELCDDFELFNDDIVTQLVHLEYTTIDNEYYITHIDHEYIIYTFDQYENRLSDNSQKGYKKVKTFKVDNAQIPFFYQYTHFQNCYETRTRKEQKDYFLFIVLDSFFKHKKLIKEYFENISNQ